MTQQEKRRLLIKAAKAAGIKGVWNVNTNSFELTETHDDFGRHSIWNPLSDDGDALLLALKLRMDVDMSSMFVVRQCGEYIVYRTIDDYLPRSVRLAIVRCAAGENDERQQG